MKLFSESVRDTIDIGRRIARNSKKGDIICLSGNLGSGKTVLTKGIAEGLGLSKKNIISPSFVLLREYTEGTLPLFHFDLYRLKDPKDILNIGYEEYLFGDGVAVIEWSDRLKSLKPESFLSINLSVKGSTKRQLIFKANGKRYKEFIREIHENLIN